MLSLRYSLFFFLALTSHAAGFTENFETKEVRGWNTTGMVAVDAAEGYRSKHSLCLEKKAEDAKAQAIAVGPTFEITSERWDLSFATRSDLTSQDNSYNGELALELLDRDGKSIERIPLADPFRRTGWKGQSKQVRFPKNATAARFVARINKETPGKFWIDELSAIRSPRQPQGALERMQFDTAQVGNLLFPEDPRTVTIEVWASEKLTDEQKVLAWEVRDYWGAEQGAPRQATLQEKGKKEEFLAYQTTVNLEDLPIALGRYYELHGTIATNGGEPFTNYTSFAVLPEAPANRYQAEEIPFTARSWDATVPAAQHLTKRLGIRIAGVWANWSSSPPYEAHSPTLDLVGELGMGCIAGIQPHWGIEARSKGHEKFTEEVLREGVRSFMKKYGHIKPMVISLGNEPHNKGDDVKKDIEAYRAVYTEFKKIDPSVFVVGTSVGPSEDYFKGGMGEWCDAYDFHSYESAKDVRHILEVKYPELFKKYGHPKPIWATETGLNSQGMSRQSVAAEVYRKAANFFAAGGANLCWFSLLYPDFNAKLVEDTTTAHNVFDSRYAKFAPKLDAIALYNTVNAIGPKKFAGESTYQEDIHAFLFRDKQNSAAQIWYKDRGREDVYLSFPEIGDVELIRLDGTRSKLNAEKKGITLTITEDPIVLLYQAPSGSTLPANLEPPPVRILSAPASVVQGGEGLIQLSGGSPEQITIETPPDWTSKPGPNGKGLSYLVTCPSQTAARRAEMVVKLAGNGELYYRPEVIGSLSLGIMPVPANDANAARILLQIDNNSDAGQKVQWEVSLVGEQSPSEGRFSRLLPTLTYFAEGSSGTADVPARKKLEVPLSLTNASLFTVYRVRASLKDSTGRTIVTERPVGGFYGVPRAGKPPAIDGKLDEVDWQSAPVRTIDKKDEFFAFQFPGKVKPEWKGPQDLSADIRYLWDDNFLYVAVDVRDDTFAGGKEDSNLWAQDGLQFLIDPSRTSEVKAGKYDYFMGIGKKGKQIWCSLSADAAAPPGEVKDMQMEVSKGTRGDGNRTYELAIPWSRVAPFTPRAGADLGFTMIVNEDDGDGRDAFMTWFGDAHNKDIDKVGDLILLP